MKAFLNKLFTLMFGSAVGQIAAAAAAPILSRLFTPEDYGVSGLVLSVSMMLVFVGTMRYEAVIVSGKTNTSRGNAFVLAGAILIVVTLSLVLVLCVLWVSLCKIDSAAEHSYSDLFVCPVVVIIERRTSKAIPTSADSARSLSTCRPRKFSRRSLGRFDADRFWIRWCGPCWPFIGKGCWANSSNYCFGWANVLQVDFACDKCKPN